MSFRILVLFLISQLLAVGAQASRVHRIEDLFAYLKEHDFSGAVQVKRGPQTLFEGQSGKKSWNAQQNFSLDTSSIIASVTKQFTAVAIMKLEEEGLLKTSDFISQYFPDFKEGHRITLHHLMTHTSGLWNYTAGPIDKQKGYTLQEIFQSIQSRPLEFEPGTQLAYTNSAHVILGAIIEKVSGLSYGEFLKQKLFLPLGMNRSGYAAKAEHLGVADGHIPNRDYGPKATPFQDVSWIYAAGGAYTTVNELMTWTKALRSGRVLSPQSYQKMKESCFDNKRTRFCYGMLVGQSHGKEAVWHEGYITGYSAIAYSVPEADLDVVVLKNFNYGALASEIARWVMDILFQGYADVPDFPTPVELPLETLQKYVGKYGRSSRVMLTVTLEGNRLYADFGLDPDWIKWMIPRSATEFYFRTYSSRFAFSPDGSSLKVNGDSIPWEKMP